MNGPAMPENARKRARSTRTLGVLGKVVGGCALAGVAAAVAFPADPASAAKGRAFVPTSINVGFTADVPCNQIIEASFTDDVDPASIGPATMFVREQNATGTGYTIQVAGTYQVAGSLVRFFPRLPGHLRDPDTGEFYPSGSPLDNASDNAAFQPSKQYQVFYVGKPAVTTIRSKRGKPLRTNYFTVFTTAAALSPDTQYTTRTYAESPPPEFSFSNPSDTYPTAATQYVTFGGTKGVPNDLSVSMFCTKVPLSPSTARVQGNVELSLLARGGISVARRPIPGSVFVEQNFQTTLLEYRPRFALADQGTYMLRVSKNVRDLTELYDFKANRSRERLRQLYDFLASERAANPPGTPAANYDDPPAALIGDWPADGASRAVLKGNILALGDAHPEEFDPRVMTIFTTRDEPVTNAELKVDFLRTDGLFDPKLSTGEWDLSVPGAASAIFTVAGGSAVNGDYFPTVSTTLNADSVAGGVFNFRDVNIPNGVTITVTGTQPVTLKAINFTLNGAINLNGANGATGTSSSSAPSATSSPRGGAGGPGGGAGGNGSHLFPSSNGQAGNTGNRGTDSNGANPSTFGGLGGLGGVQCTGTYYCYGGGGGGGGGRAAGKDGGTGTYTFYPSWNGAAGRGGAGSSNTELNPLVGGAGGGSGGQGRTYYWAVSGGWGYLMGSGGGGGGGAILVQTAKVMTIGAQGKIRANGGNGGSTASSGTGGVAGAGGGGGGGSILLRSTGGFNFANAAANFEALPGNGGTVTVTYGAVGGAGGAGYLRAEDPNGGIALPNGTQGNFDPVGGGVPSFVYSQWADLGVQDPRILAFTNADIATNPTANDAILVECQMTREDPGNFDSPDKNFVDGSQNTTDATKTSPWIPIKIHDRTNTPGGAFRPAGWSPVANGSEFAGFPVTAINNRSFRFIRFRIFFQLDSLHARTDPTPSVDSITTHFQFNL